jgi:alanyl-tRNA synthetase
MDTAEVRRRFLAHFEARDHTVVPSAPLILDDPTLLFVGAGMVPFKPYFLGQDTPPYRRAVSVQKCARTVDIEEVGKTTRHGTFFQMCGNFSFGDYFKKGAIEAAWELVTRSQADGGYGLDEARLYASVYLDDEEAVALWKQVAGLSDDRIVRLGMKDNFWSMGVPGPCGPCSEILIDRGPEFGADRDWEAGDRYLEFWNLVFMQNTRGEGGIKEEYEITGELPAKNIDTGMGLERVAYLLQGVDNMYEIDEMYPVIAKTAEISGRRYGADHDDDVRMRVVGDHIRSAMMLIGDGVTPGNEARGYVLRRLIRRAVRSVRLLGYEDPCLPELLPESYAKMRLSYPDLDDQWARIQTVAYGEEEAFRHTLRSGTVVFEGAVRDLGDTGRTTLSGAQAFALHDTYGFPIDLTLEMAAERGLEVDEQGFRDLMQQQRDRARADSKAKKGRHADDPAYRELRELGATDLLAYDGVTAEARVRGLVRDGEVVTHAGAGEQVEIVLDRTPFYPEGGGQAADEGAIIGDGWQLKVVDVQAPIKGLVVHRVRVESGEVTPGAAVSAEVDPEWRLSACQAHSGTHVVHAALRKVLGPTALQAGSYNRPGYLRFDFSWSSALSDTTRRQIEDEANQAVRHDLPVLARTMSLEAARDLGALALFGESYDQQVRVVDIGDHWSTELCGGTHVQHASQIGALTISSESSIGSGVRRLEALVGIDALHSLGRERALVAGLTDLLKVRPEQLTDRVAELVERVRAAERELDRVRVAALLARAGDLASAARDVYGVQFAGTFVEGADGGDVRALALDVRNRLVPEQPAVVTVIGSQNGKPNVVIAVNDRARQWGLRAGELVKAAAGALGGNGGGKDDVAQGGGTDSSQAPLALERVEHAIGASVTSPSA